jgi:hypothetical protein
VCCVLFEHGLLFCMVRVICVLRPTVVPLPPGKTPFAFKIIIIVIFNTSHFLLLSSLILLKYIRIFSICLFNDAFNIEATYYIVTH